MSEELNNLSHKYGDVSRFTPITISEERINEINSFIDKLYAKKKTEGHYSMDIGSFRKRWFTGLCGEAAVEILLKEKFIDLSVGDSSDYHISDLKSIGVNCGVKTVEWGKLPIVFKNSRGCEIIVIKQSYADSYICGLATPDVINKYQSDEYIISPSLKKRGTKSAFYGFDNLVMFSNKEELIASVKKGLNNGFAKSEALDGIFKEILKETDKAIYTVYHTLDKSRDGYDCLAIQYSKATGEKTKRMFFEVVISTDYDTIFIEKQKLDAMKKLVWGDEDKIYYVNFTPINTVVYDLLKMELQFSEHEKKEVAYLDDTNGTVFSYIYNLDIDESFEAFPKDEAGPTEMELERKAINGEITFNSSTDFKSLPYHIQWRYVAENFLQLFLFPTEDKQEMLAKYGSVEKLYKFVKERERQRFLARYGYFVEEPNKYEIKD